MFDKVKAAGAAVIGAAGMAALAEVAVVDWDEVLADSPGPDFLKAAAVAFLLGAIPTVRAWWKREVVGYGEGVPRTDGPYVEKAGGEA